MGLLDLFRPDGGTTKIADRAEIISRYKRLHKVGTRLNNKLVGQLSKDVLDEGAKKLGILQNGIFVFDSEDESAVLMDSVSTMFVDVVAMPWRSTSSIPRLTRIPMRWSVCERCNMPFTRYLSWNRSNVDSA